MNQQNKKIYIEKFCAWAPGIESFEDWTEWKLGRKEIIREALTPKLSFVPMLLRRRLSALTKMAMYVDYMANDGLPKVKTTFASEFGEFTQQYKISDQLIDSQSVSPAAFSLSVFNSAIAHASIFEQNKEGYSAVFSGKNAFEYGLRDCVNSLLMGECETRAFLYGDELLPSFYSELPEYPNVPCALAMRLTIHAENALCELNLSPLPEMKFAAEQALVFLRERILK